MPFHGNVITLLSVHVDETKMEQRCIEWCVSG